MERFYKLVDNNLCSFHDPTFQYVIGKSKRPTQTGRIPEQRDQMCSGWLLHASRTPEQTTRFAGRWPWRLLYVEGRPIVEDDRKAGFRQLRVIEEISVAACFGPNGSSVVDVLNTVCNATGEQLEKFYVAWAAARDAATRAAAWDVARDAAGAAVVADLVGQHGLEQQHIETLMAPYVSVFGRPDWMGDES